MNLHQLIICTGIAVATIALPQTFFSTARAQESTSEIPPVNPPASGFTGVDDVIVLPLNDDQVAFIGIGSTHLTAGEVMMVIACRAWLYKEENGYAAAQGNEYLNGRDRAGTHLMKFKFFRDPVPEGTSTMTKSLCPDVPAKAASKKTPQ
ncbi:hypothetical protein [Parvibaculum sp.]|uniref:hypothetical protein n=1 Tax=Parvibaculum sp. TaxID=2024848 RepID=UPI001B091C74|nr:hypothetical protein [Parvibaculum sp.]MBO6634149.1 hypothetical protein [Parvibaculum sp.]MBO6679526.1 hypothetical protein [Parvibaculum sp.]MBO6686130.1 hypothetical protein [Parvibaculum sp.]